MADAPQEHPMKESRMKPDVLRTLHECSVGSIAETMTFPEIVARLAAVGTESYCTDLYRREKTYYLATGESHVEPEGELDPQEFAASSVAADFSADSVKEAITANQRGTITYVEFLRRIMAAGTTAYCVYIRGRRAIYVGRTGDFHVELFPVAT
jgi:uncharacterized protein YbcV (DUF1398 family)